MVVVGGVLAGVAVVAGCSSSGASAVFAGGRRSAGVVFAGTARHVYVTVPSRPTGLLIALHGVDGTGERFAAETRLSADAQAAHLAVVYPDGVDHEWDAGTCCFAAADNRVDDVGFVESLIAMAERALPIDHRRVYVAGFSNGGMLAYRLACEDAGQIAAVAVVDATMTSFPCRPARPVSVMQVSAVHDPLIGYDRGYSGPVNGQRVRLEELPAVAAVAQWRGFDGCAAARPVVAGTGVTATGAACAAGTAVAFYSLAAAGHAWPGGAYPGAAPASFRATPVVLGFLLAHP